MVLILTIIIISMVVVKASLVLAILLAVISANKEYEILALADIHLDLEYKAESAPFCRDSTKADFIAPFGRGECDTPMSLFKNVLARAKAHFKESPPKFVLVNGDIVGHGIAESYGFERAKQTIVAIKDTIH